MGERGAGGEGRRSSYRNGGRLWGCHIPAEKFDFVFDVAAGAYSSATAWRFVEWRVHAPVGETRCGGFFPGLCPGNA